MVQRFVDQAPLRLRARSFWRLRFRPGELFPFLLIQENTNLTITFHWKVVAPVRETAAQALATLLPYMSPPSVRMVQNILVAMVEQNGAPPSRGLDAKSDPTATAEKGKYVWQVRHSGLLGLKYLVAVRGDLLVQKIEDDEEVKPDVKPEGSRDITMLSVKGEEGVDAEDYRLGMLKGVVDAGLLGYAFSFYFDASQEF